MNTSLEATKKADELGGNKHMSVNFTYLMQFTQKTCHIYNFLGALPPHPLSCQLFVIAKGVNGLEHGLDLLRQIKKSIILELHS